MRYEIGFVDLDVCGLSCRGISASLTCVVAAARKRPIRKSQIVLVCGFFFVAHFSKTISGAFQHASRRR